MNVSAKPLKLPASPTSADGAKLTHAVALAILLLTPLAGCGGGGGDSGQSNAPPIIATPSPAPTPAPTPTPTPIAIFAAVAGRIFDSPHLGGLTLMGRGWSQDYAANGSSPPTNVRDAGDITVAYDATAGAYQLTVPLLGSGILFQTAEARSFEGRQFYNATVAPSAGDAMVSTHKNSLLVLSPGVNGTSYRDVTWIKWSAAQPIDSSLHTATQGVFGLARPSPVSAVPRAGLVRYTTLLQALMGGNLGDLLTGVGSVDFDFARSTLSGALEISLQCFMGCSYPATTYQFENTTYSAGSLSFSGELVTQGTTTRGTFSGTFAGPFAAEILISFEAPYFDPDIKTWVMARGVILGKGPDDMTPVS